MIYMISLVNVFSLVHWLADVLCNLVHRTRQSSGTTTIARAQWIHFLCMPPALLL